MLSRAREYGDGLVRTECHVVLLRSGQPLRLAQRLVTHELGADSSYEAGRRSTSRKLCQDFRRRFESRSQCRALDKLLSIPLLEHDILARADGTARRGRDSDILTSGEALERLQKLHRPIALASAALANSDREGVRHGNRHESDEADCDVALAHRRHFAVIGSTR